RGSFVRRQQALDRIVEQSEEILRLRGAADREGQRHDGNIRPLGKKLRRAGIVVRRIDDRLRRAALHALDELGEVRGRRRDAELGDHLFAASRRSIVSSNSPKRSFAFGVPPTVKGSGTTGIFARWERNCAAPGLLYGE